MYSTSIKIIFLPAKFPQQLGPRVTDTKLFQAIVDQCTENTKKKKIKQRFCFNSIIVFFWNRSSLCYYCNNLLKQCKALKTWVSWSDIKSAKIRVSLNVYGKLTFFSSFHPNPSYQLILLENKKHLLIILSLLSTILK